MVKSVSFNALMTILRYFGRQRLLIQRLTVRCTLVFLCVRLGLPSILMWKQRKLFAANLRLNVS
ncbi:hypothetical protein DF041_36505 [Burkholderia cepacia]|nr:hypothetical protein DF041_36505 [Burkholderia cepacia]